MKILAVNNTSDTWDELVATITFAGHDVTPVEYTEIGQIDAMKYDAAVLSGGWWYDDEIELLEHYGEEISFIRTAPIPVLGICIGMQLMHVSLDRAVPLLDEPQSGIKEIMTTSIAQQRYGFPPTMRVYKNHTRGFINVDPVFDILAVSPGHVEMMRHTERPMLGVQFHPEVGQPDECAALLQRLLALIVRRQL